jgi:radical SAM superfamily enzyme YgiQ (UPF0313 family)
MAPSLSLITLANLTPNSHQVILEDENVQKLNLNDNPDLVGITVNVDTAHRAYQLARIYQKKEVPVILGGIHPSSNPEEAKDYADSICIGEAESLWPEIIEDTRLNQLRPRYYHSEPTDLKLVPPLERNLIKSQQYLYTNVLYLSRGCPFSCEFCYNSCDYVFHRYRTRPIKTIIQEIKQLPTKHVMFIDDNIIGNLGWTRRFLQAIKPLDLTWNGAVSTNLVHHPDLIDQMKASGCKSLFIGFESINQQALDSVNKRQNKLNLYQKLIKQLHDRGIMINASLVFGFDHDGPKVFDQTLDWLIKHKIETMTAHILTPYPGTKLYSRLEEEDRITSRNWSLYNTANVVFQPKLLSKRELKQGYLDIYDQFYSWKNILRRLPRDRSQWKPYLLFNLGYRKFGKITSQLSKLGLMNSVGQLARRLSYGID